IGLFPEMPRLQSRRADSPCSLPVTPVADPETRTIQKTDNDGKSKLTIVSGRSQLSTQCCPEPWQASCKLRQVLKLRRGHRFL
ncbi:hypothetical protein RSW38_25300, partial [Escherichia coli]|nr:hypothetical protein [Escherichia coli]